VTSTWSFILQLLQGCTVQQTLATLAINYSTMAGKQRHFMCTLKCH